MQPLGGRALPEMVQPVEYVGERLEFVNQHKASVLRALRRYYSGRAKHDETTFPPRVEGNVNLLRLLTGKKIAGRTQMSKEGMCLFGDNP